MGDRWTNIGGTMRDGAVSPSTDAEWPRNAMEAVGYRAGDLALWVPRAWQFQHDWQDPIVRRGWIPDRRPMRASESC